MKIYTKTGDKGLTGLVGGARISKADDRIQAIGDVDELNALIGVARTLAETGLDSILHDIQHWLFDLGAELATPPESKFENKSIGPTQVAKLESSIDTLTLDIEPLRNFILPGGAPFAAALHHARTVCRRAERSVIALNPDRAEPVIFLNRLSDWLFTAARYANRSVGDVKWSKSDS